MNAPTTFAQPFALTAGETAELAREDMAVARLAFASGCSRSTFASIFGGDVDLAEHDGWHLAMVRGDWTATKGARTLRAATLGGIHAKVKKATRSPLPRSLPRTVSTPAVAFEARDGERFRVRATASVGGAE